MLDVEKTALAGLLILTPRRFGDARGFFAETWNTARFAEVAGIDPEFVQDNHSLSARGRHHSRAALSGAAQGAGQAGALRARGAV